MKDIDLNCDMGEVREAIDDGSQEALMPFLTSVNVACGGHAGDDEMMRATIAQARRWKLALGAHPGYPDRANFGRVPVEMPLEAVAETVFEQVTAFARIAAETG
ncbi:MAG: LamB/YcsF family protein, partial [Bryobacterales bacterium]|nr:LamB/YcsF family protein [Bryobacterales bacterium]